MTKIIHTQSLFESLQGTEVRTLCVPTVINFFFSENLTIHNLLTFRTHSTDCTVCIIYLLTHLFVAEEAKAKRDDLNSSPQNLSKITSKYIAEV